MKRLFTFLILCAAFAQVKAQIHLSVSPTNISCFGGRNGSITTSVSNGTSPYTYLWSTGATTSSISSLASGYYVVTVTDANSVTASNNATLTEPTTLNLTLTPSVYNTVNNISCPSCCNGYINISVTGGVTSYSYAWSSSVIGYSSTSSNISNLCKGIYTLTVTDANGCTITDNKTMTEPDKDTWSMTGNSGSNPSTQFIGNTDSVDLSFRTNNTERLRVKANGILKLNKLASASSYGQMLIDSIGQLLRVNPDDSTAAYNAATAWVIGGNSIGNGSVEFLGTRTAKPLVIKTNAKNDPSSERMRITVSGFVGIGTSTPSAKLEISHNDENGGLILNRYPHDVSDDSKHSEIKFNYNGTEKWAIGNDLYNDGDQTFFIWDHEVEKTRFLIDNAGRTFIGFNDLPCTTCNSSLYRLYVDNGIVARDVKVTADDLPDYVFNADYKPMSIYELEQFVKQNKHLPEIPSAKEIESNEGFEVGNLQMKLLKKIEEQSLYIISLQKQIDALNEKVSKLSKN